MAEFVDPYLDPDTGLLRNLVGAVTKSELDAAEADLVWPRAVQLLEHPLRATSDLSEFRAIHRHLFQDVYPWAGEIRTVDMRKNIEGAQFFLPVSMIDQATAFTADELLQDRFLRDMSRNQFIDRLSYHYDQWNYIHPFREGNGRTQRLFWTRIAVDAGWQLDWRPVQGSVNDAACRAATDEQNLTPLREMFDRVVTTAGATPTFDVDRLALGTTPGDTDGERRDLGGRPQ